MPALPYRFSNTKKTKHAFVQINVQINLVIVKGPAYHFHLAQKLELVAVFVSRSKRDLKTASVPFTSVSSFHGSRIWAPAIAYPLVEQSMAQSITITKSHSHLWVKLIVVQYFFSTTSEGASQLSHSIGLPIQAHTQSAWVRTHSSFTYLFKQTPPHNVLSAF